MIITDDYDILIELKETKTLGDDFKKLLIKNNSLLTSGTVPWTHFATLYIFSHASAPSRNLFIKYKCNKFM